jgi:hypothetical protein
MSRVQSGRAEKALAQNRHAAVVLRGLVVTRVHSGRVERAKHVRRDLLAIQPQLTLFASEAASAPASPSVADAEGFIRQRQG